MINNLIIQNRELLYIINESKMEKKIDYFRILVYNKLDIDKK